ncbi:MAG TPA: heparan-alpha-glucosaminide N-acetyltransferase domain-containing protein [Methylomirabilota bacterium]|jgi:predicted acyltransferase
MARPAPLLIDVERAPTVVESAAVRPSPRLQSLDVFRGLTIAAMLLVNNPGSWSHVYPPLEHVPWDGWTPTDLVFPFFLVIVGITTTFSLGGLMERGAGRGVLFRKALMRAVIIFALGLAMQGFPDYDLSTIRVPGVLQRIALSYLIAATIVLWTGVRGQLVALVALLVGYWVLMTRVPVPGLGSTALAPDLNLSNWLDLKLIGRNHLMHETMTWDPEGTLSTLGGVASVMCGVLAGHWIRSPRVASAKVIGLIVAGGAGVVLGSLWSRTYPIIKNLWTGSFVLLSAGMAFLLLAAIYWLVDVKGYRGWAVKPFLVFGTNAITAYWLSSLMGIVLNWIVITSPEDGESLVLQTYIHETFYARWLSPENASLAYAISFVLLWLLLLSLLYRRRIFIRI